MRDIRPDLRNRLEEIDAEQGRLNRRQEVLQQQAAAIKTVLEIEEGKWANRQEVLPGMNGIKSVNGRLSKPNAIFLGDALRDGPKSLDDLKRRAAQLGIEFEKDAGRVLHFALVGLQRNGYVRRLEDGRWEWAEEVGVK